MDEDVLEKLAVVADSISAMSEFLRSNELDLSDLTAYRDCLASYTRTVTNYISLLQFQQM